MIRNLTYKDLSAVRYICLHASSAPQTPAFKEASLLVFCDYYVQYECSSSFVFENKSGEACGYIFCSPDYEKWKKNLTAFLQTHTNPIANAMAHSIIESMKPFADRFPSHLHIDIHPKKQGKGIGGKLIEHLKDFLSEQNVKGLMLQVAADNFKAQEFYNKHGFQSLLTSDNEITMGIRL